MDHQAFDRLTRLVGTATSRRTAWRALLTAVLLGAGLREAAGSARCDNANTPRCGRGPEAECCPGKCFRHVETEQELCCTAAHQRIICPTAGGQRCCHAVGVAGEDPCDCCRDPGAESARAATADHCPGLIAGSYRRR
jgi:hypothetical protein